MAVTTKVVRVANPRRRGRGKFRLATSKRKKNSARRRKMSPKQIRIFGTPAQKAALKRKRRGKRKAASSRRVKRNGGRKRTRRANPQPRVKVIYRYRTAVNPKRRTHHRRSNPAMIVTLGSVNPKRRTKVARRKRRNTRSHSRRRRNTRRTRVVVMAPKRRRRRSNGRHRRRMVNGRHHRRRSSRNPFHGGGSRDMVIAGGGILAGVALTKIIPNYIPSSLSSSIGSGGIMSVIVSAASAWLGGFALSKVNTEFGRFALYGGIAQTISVALNAFVPSLAGPFSLGDLINGQFPVPQNPIRAAAAVASAAPVARGMSAYGPAY